MLVGYARLVCLDGYNRTISARTMQLLRSRPPVPGRGFLGHVPNGEEETVPEGIPSRGFGYLSVKSEDNRVDLQHIFASDPFYIMVSRGHRLLGNIIGALNHVGSWNHGFCYDNDVMNLATGASRKWFESPWMRWLAGLGVRNSTMSQLNRTLLHGGRNRP